MSDGEVDIIADSCEENQKKTKPSKRKKESNEKLKGKGEKENNSFGNNEKSKNQIRNSQVRDSKHDSDIASVETAEMHATSRMIYAETPDNDPAKMIEKQKCPCCGFPVGGTPLDFTCPSEELSQLGSSFPMIFKLNRYSIFALIFALIAAIACFADNIAHGEDEWTYENSFNLLTPATFGKDFEVSIWQPILHIVVCGVLVFYFMWVIGKIKSQSIEIDTFLTTPSDFTLIVRGLPNDYKPEDLRSHIEKHFQMRNMKIANFVPTYDISEYMETTSLLNDWKFQYKLVKNYQNKYNKPMQVTKCCCCKTELEGPEGCKAEIEELKKKQKELISNMSTEKMGKVAFITMTNQITTREIAEEMGRSNMQRVFDKIFPCFVNERHKFNGNYIHAEMAPDHSDINWENLAVPTSKKFFRRFITVFVALLVLGIAVAIMAGTAAWKVQVNENKDNESADSIRAATIIPSIITVIINFMVARIIRILSAYEKHSTWTDFNRSVLNMLIVFILLNNIGIPIFIYIALDQDWFSFGGLAYTVFWLEIMNSFVSPVIYVIGPKNLAKKLMQCIYRRKEKNGELNVSQKQANLIFEGPELDLPDRFVNIIKNFSLCLFYAPIVPIGVPIAIFGLLFEMMAFKIMLVRVHSRPKNYNSDLVIQAASWIRWGLLLYSLGIFIFYQKLVEELFYLELFFFIAMCGYTLTPISALCDLCFKDKTLEILRKEYENDEKYNNFFSVLPKFYSDYERENPVTREKGIKRFDIYLNCLTPESYFEMKPIKKQDLPQEKQNDKNSNSISDQENEMSPVEGNNLVPQVGYPIPSPVAPSSNYYPYVPNNVQNYSPNYVTSVAQSSPADYSGYTTYPNLPPLPPPSPNQPYPN